ncbi:iron-containing alcohol dehydrogenase PsrA [Burkholderia pseudomultivorans]|uniref:iron-containing alcohol dehydrogenase PsrA n=1 Tax=Burkholderia pseudomultivorans TaxID=1207504 RepID=UPI000759E44A|nr:iron-containing alcohol dehydrogenase PsrA [Burkholderia pseudomultivorans]KVC29613.1 alcohol dehydrogenase [Burkholderia pseudomultivorans]KVC36075.1 alcohol dehydrogenase [Burkholderia pseudomultivorans]
MSDWRFHNPVRIRFGIDSLADAPDALAGRSYAIVTYPDAVFARLADRLEAQLGPALARIDCVEANPSVPMLRRACERLAVLPRKPDVLVALGGGSVIDSAKVLAAEHGDFDRVLRILSGDSSTVHAALPILAIPTTAGTGSEVTHWATVWDPHNARKLSLSRPDLYPETVIVDPRLMIGLPMQPTIASGLDALSHALESIWNVHANPVTRGLAVHAARELIRGLGRVNADLDDLDARSDMALGALRAGLAFSNTHTALAHNISYAITLTRGVAHGIACSFCLPAVMQAAIGVDGACDAALCEIFGDTDSAPAQLVTLLDALGVARHPAAYGIDANEWAQIVDHAFDGARGRNFIGTRARFPHFDFSPEQPERALH